MTTSASSDAGPVTIVAIGAGNRTNKYLEYAVRHPERLKLVGVVELNPLRRKAVAESQEQIQGWLLPADGSAARPQTFTLSGLTEDERQIILDGCLINFYNRH